MTRQQGVTPQSFLFQRNFGIRGPFIKYFKIIKKSPPHFFFALRGQSSFAVFAKFAKTTFFQKIITTTFFIGQKIANVFWKA